MKKILITIMTLAMLAGLMGCGAVGTVAAGAVSKLATSALSGGGDNNKTLNASVDTEVVGHDKKQTAQIGDSMEAPVEIKDVAVKDGSTMNVKTTTVAKQDKVDATHAEKVDVVHGESHKIDASSAKNVTMNNTTGISMIWLFVGMAIAGMIGLYMGVLLDKRNVLLQKVAAYTEAEESDESDS